MLTTPAVLLKSASSVPLPAAMKTQLPAGHGVVVGVRPENFEIDPHGSIGVEINAVEWLGHECLISAELEGNPLIVRQVGMVQNPPGSQLSLSVDPEHVHVFDSVTTERIP